MRSLLAVCLIALASAASAQMYQGGSGNQPRPMRYPARTTTDIPFRGGLSDTRTVPLASPAEQASCLERKSDGRIICHKRKEWERIAAGLPAAR